MTLDTISAQTFGRNYADIFTRLVTGIVGVGLGIWLLSKPVPTYYAAQHSPLTDLFIQLLTLGCLLLIVNGLWVLFTTPIISLNESGLQLQSRSGTRTWAWNEINGISGKMTKASFPPFIGTGDYKLFHDDQLLFQVSSTTARALPLYDLLANIIMHTHKADCIRRLNEAETLKFGQVNLRLNSIDVGNDSIAMNDVTSAAANEDYVMIYANDRIYPWKGFRYGRFYNPHLFMELVNTLVLDYRREALVAFQAGQTLTFGKVRLNNYQIQAGSQSIRLRDVSDVQIDNQHVMIISDSRKVVWRILQKDFYNPLLFQELVRRVIFDPEYQQNL